MLFTLLLLMTVKVIVAVTATVTATVVVKVIVVTLAIAAAAREVVALARRASAHRATACSPYLQGTTYKCASYLLLG